MNYHALLLLTQHLKSVLLHRRLCSAHTLWFSRLLKLEVANCNWLPSDAFEPVTVRFMYHHHPLRLLIDYVSIATISLAATFARTPSTAAILLRFRTVFGLVARLVAVEALAFGLI